MLLLSVAETRQWMQHGLQKSKGVEKVYIVYRRTREFMPADQEELKLALEDGVIFKELLAPISLKMGS